MKHFSYIILLGITCAAVLASACNPLDVDTPRDVRIENPDPDLRPTRTVALMYAVDASASMGPDDDLLHTIAAAKSSLDLLDGRFDLAGLVWFNYVVKATPLMTNMYAVGKALDGILPTGSNLTWDGAYAAAEVLVNSEPRDIRAIILVSDGSDDGSIIKRDSLIAYARKNHVYIYTIGLRNSVVREDLIDVASQTEGRYYHNEDNADSLRVIFREIIIDRIRQTP